MCILSHVDIRREMADGNLVITPFNKKQVRPNSYDWRLGPTILTADPLTPNAWVPTILTDGETFIFRPEYFYLCTTIEKVLLPKNIMANMTGRSSVGRLGMIVHLTAGHVDAGFPGHLTAEVKVLGPWDVPMKIGERAGQLIFEYLRTPAELGYADYKDSKYINQEDVPVPSRRAWEGAVFNSKAATAAFQAG